MPVITIHTDIAAPKEIVFDLSRSIDMHTLSTQQTNEEAVAGKTSGLIGAGEWVTWRAKHFGVYQNLTSKITEFNTPDYFVDEMVKGAFKRFRHAHHFKTIDGSHTSMIDVFDYTSPFGFLGRMADRLFLKDYMKGLLLKRNEMVKEFAESEKWKRVLQGDD